MIKILIYCNINISAIIYIFNQIFVKIWKIYIIIIKENVIKNEMLLLLYNYFVYYCIFLKDEIKIIFIFFF